MKSPKSILKNSKVFIDKFRDPKNPYSFYLLILQQTLFTLFIIFSMFTTLIQTAPNDPLEYTWNFFSYTLFHRDFRIFTIIQVILSLLTIFLVIKEKNVNDNKKLYSFFNLLTYVILLLLNFNIYFSTWTYRYFLGLTIPAQGLVLISYKTNLFGVFANMALILLSLIYFLMIYLNLDSVQILNKMFFKNVGVIKKASINPQHSARNLKDLKKLLDEGIISKEVFDEKSKKYIEEL